LKDFAASHPTVQPARRTVTLDITAEEFYRAPADQVSRLYNAYLGE
jgi:hypothetical protein